MKLKANPDLKHIPVIAVTASSFREEEARARKACDGFIRKPFNRAELLAELKRFVRPVALAAPLATADSQVPPVSVSTAALAQRPALLEKLTKEEQTVWPGVCQRMEMGEIEAFARRLKTWADDGEFSELQRYATALLEQVEAFDVDRLPSMLQEFASICRALRSVPTPNS
jgi:CheY-like chemotaxis protein